MTVKIKLLDGGKMPEFKHDGDACADCYARIDDDKEITVPKGERMLVPLGFAIGLEKGWEAQVRPRSGLSLKGIDVALGTVDAGYTGEVKVCVINNSESDVTIFGGDRICQLAVRKIPEIRFEQTDELQETERGADGFGSTGTR